jgi:RecB family exonuclease
VHAVADRVARGELAAGPDDADEVMQQLDQVWDRLEFRTPWSREREHARIRLAVERFLAWHHANPRELLGTETRFSTVVELAGGRQVELTGSADRLELTADGRVVVVDLKTARTRPSGVAVRRDLQLALYQYAVDGGALDDLRPGALAGGAELVQLGSLDEAEGAVVQAQDAAAADGPERVVLAELIDDAAGVLRAERFPALPGDHCRSCAFLAICPARSAGPVVAG